MRRVVYLLFILVVTRLFGTPEPLKITDVRNTLEELFSYHIEQKELNSLIVKRSVKLFIEQFDSNKIYLLHDEVKPFLELSPEEIESIVNHYFEDTFPLYDQLNETIERAIHRAVRLRQELRREFITNLERKEGLCEESLYQFPVTEEALKNKLRNQFIRFLEQEKRQSGVVSWSSEKIDKVFNLIEKRFVRFEQGYLRDRLSREHFFAAHLLKAFAKSLDAHTAFFSPEEAFEMRASLEKQFEGLGVVLQERVDGIFITSLIKGGPAERSQEILVGDLLLEINGISVEKISYEDVLQMLNQKRDVKFVLGRLDTSGTRIPVSVELKKEKIVLSDDRLSWDYEPFGSGIIGKIRLPSFYESSQASSCEADLREALKELKKKGKVLGLVLDMRENLGGFLTQAVKVAGLFITSGVVVVSRYAQSEIQYMRSLDPRVYYNGPFVILTSKVSASAAEIVAQALQDYGVALVVGDGRTYGKGSIQYQTVTDPTASNFFKVTIGKYYTVSGQSTQIRGVEADISIPTAFSPYNIGERFLEYPLSNDRVPEAYFDALLDVDEKSKLWLQKNYLPYLQKKESVWQQMLPELQRNSALRVNNDPNYQLFLEELNNKGLKKGGWGESDLPLQEAVNVVKDMATIHQKSDIHK